MAKSIMIQGAGSNVGKSMIVAGLCRAYLQRGLVVRPFKPQNMSNNAAVTADGGEIGRAQALQALACGVAPHSDMNPVLLKPETETGAQVVVQGKHLCTVKARDYAKLKPQLLAAVTDSFARLRETCDLVLVEGAGSAAETNLRAGDIANMGFAEAVDIPVILLGDIDRGGVIAQIVGTNVVLSGADRTRIKGFIINKFRGDPSLFDDGMAEIMRRSGWLGLGVLPWFSKAGVLPAEDILDITSTKGGAFKIAIPKLSRIANFDDLDPLKLEPSVTVDIVEPGRPLPGDADLVLIPGTKSTIADLAFFRDQGWDIDLAAHIRRNGRVLGICGGYQMLGQKISDPQGIEGTAQTVAGLGHLDVVTTMQAEKRLAEVEAFDRHTGVALRGYEIHIGQTTGPDCLNHRFTVQGQAHGAGSGDGRIIGTYLHGMFADDDFRAAFLADIGVNAGQVSYGDAVESALNDLADHLEQHLDLDQILALA